METFPFTKDEWHEVEDLATRACNASLMEDEVLEATRFQNLKDYLLRLSQKYGEHPILLETEADFERDDTIRVSLYGRAKLLAAANGLDSMSISLSLSDALLACGRPVDAERELLECRSTVARRGDESERNEWRRLFDQAKQARIEESNRR